MAAPRVVAAAGLAAILLASACTYSDREPGLFPDHPAPSAAATAAPTGPPEPTDPRLPVAAEVEWTTADDVHAVVRFAVHAVRRVGGATVLDWSVTPISAPGFRRGDTLPFVDLGLGHSGAGDVNVFLLDPTRGSVYRPLSHRSEAEFNRCLCTPLWAVQQGLRVGETRLLQTVFPELPVALDHIDVDLVNLAPFSHVPVTPVGRVPIAAVPTDLARAAESRPVTSAERVYQDRDRPKRVQSIRIDRVVSAPGRTSVEWTLRSLTDHWDLGWAAPVSAPVRDPARVVDTNVTSGPQIRPHGSGGAPLSVQWMTAKLNGNPAYECLCSTLGLWAAGLRHDDGAAGVAGNYPPLPPGTTSVDVLLPGVGTLSDVPVVAAVDVGDTAARVGAPVTIPAPAATWTYRVDDPPRGWATSQWPTPLPDPAQLDQYRATVEHLAGPPG